MLSLTRGMLKAQLFCTDQLATVGYRSTYQKEMLRGAEGYDMKWKRRCPSPGGDFRSLVHCRVAGGGTCRFQLRANADSMTRENSVSLETERTGDASQWRRADCEVDVPPGTRRALGLVAQKTIHPMTRCERIAGHCVVLPEEDE